MIAHVHQALAQVRAMHQHLIEKQRFKGYSGRARAFSGCVALLAAWFLQRIPARTDLLVLWVWLAVAALCFAVNGGAVLAWFLWDPQVSRDARRLKPTFEVVPAILAGAVLTVRLWHDGAFSYLVPIWMIVFGLANWASRHVLPRGIAAVAFLYLLCGTILLLVNPLPFTNPWPMGIVFFIGEWMGGWALHRDE